MGWGRFFSTRNRFVVLNATFEVLRGSEGAEAFSPGAEGGVGGGGLRLEARVRTMLHEKCVSIVDEILEGNLGLGDKSAAIEGTLRSIRS